MSRGRRALMMIRDDLVIQTIADDSRARRQAANDRIESLNKEANALVEKMRAEENDALKEVEQRLSEIGVAIFDAKNHEVSFHPDEGVIWLEPKTADCQCGFCRLHSLFGGG